MGFFTQTYYSEISLPPGEAGKPYGSGAGQRSFSGPSV